MAVLHEFVITMSDMAVILQALNNHTHLKCPSVFQLLDFLIQASALKQHIILAQPADEPTSCALLILPSLVCEFLPKTTGIVLQAVQDAWDVLKDIAWAMSPLADCVVKEKEAFRKFGWSHSFNKSLLPLDSSFRMVLWIYGHIPFLSY